MRKLHQYPTRRNESTGRPEVNIGTADDPRWVSRQAVWKLRHAMQQSEAYQRMRERENAARRKGE